MKQGTAHPLLTLSSASLLMGSTTFILTRVYSWGLLPSPDALSWSAQGCPSLGE